MLSDLSFEEIIRTIGTNPLVAIAVVMALVNWAKDTYGLNGKTILPVAVVASGLVSVFQFVGPYKVSEFVFGGWIWSTLVYAIGAILAWSGVVKPLLHKARGTEPQQVTNAKAAGVKFVPFGNKMERASDTKEDK